MNEFEEKLGNLIEEKIKKALKESGLLDLVRQQKIIEKSEPVWEHIIHCKTCQKELEKRGYKIFKIVPYSKK